MISSQPIHIKTISEYHRMLGLPKPQHPLISVIDLESFDTPFKEGRNNLIFDLYAISLKKNFHLKMKYGQQPHDFDEGTFFCMSPGQTLSIEIEKGQVHQPSGWMILIHPDFLWNTSLAKTIKQYQFFSYHVTEALHLSEKEEAMITGIVKYLEQEYNSNIDKYSQNVIIAQLELLLTYAERFYQRQFITRKVASHEVLARLEDLLSDYFNSDALAKQGLPTVSYIAQNLNISPGYLTSLLKTLTGQSTQQHLHHKLIEVAKEKLSTTHLSVSEIAYQLGFEHLPSFSKLFKTKTNFSPLEFRNSFN